MKISNRSWHLRLVRVLSSGYTPTNLCNYFWKVVGTLVFFLLAIILSPVVIPALGIIWLEEKVRDRDARKLPKQQKQPGLVHAWISAKKQRVCPIIIVEGEEEEPCNV